MKFTNHTLHRLKFRQDGDYCRRCADLSTLGRIIVGRSPDNEVYIKSKFVSRHHAQLISDENGCVIEDLNSTNGVFLAEKQVKKYRLRDGDVVSLGVHELIYTDLRQREEFDGAETIAEESPTNRTIRTRPSTISKGLEVCSL